MKLNDREYILLADALSLAILVLEKLPDEERAESVISDMRVLRGRMPGGISAETQNTAQRRLEILITRPTADILPFPTR